MKYIKPTPITNTEFVSSTRAETDYAAWSGATTYALADHVISTTTHRIYESVQAGNLNHAVTDVAWWIDIGPTNRWAMFDTAVGSITTQATPLTVVLVPGIIDALALLDVSGQSVNVLMEEGAVEVYNTTYALPDTALVDDWYGYFFEEIIPTTVLVVTDLPVYSTSTLTVTITADTTAACGTLVVGRLVDLGSTLADPSIGIVDYSRKETDAYGLTSVVERAYAKKIDADFILENYRIDHVARNLASIRATPVVWLADDQVVYESLIAYGFYKDWGINIPYPSHSEARITIEGLI